MQKTYNKDDPVIITKGNNKLGPIPNISLPPIVSCVPGVRCARPGQCYALKYQYRVKNARAHNWEVWKKDPDRFFRELHAFIAEDNSPYFRFHPDGDIPDQNYLDRMSALARKLPQTRFLAFTKRYSLKFAGLPDNLVVIPSMWPDMKIPEHLLDRQIAWMQDNTEDRVTRSHYVCEHGCSDCYTCWHIQNTGKDVLFPKH